ncbi:PhnA protein [Pseudopedobacter saltans DSM 12145]|uniref:PhnA protein n=2 Tax=Pseudopedobacter saltans TaxID=151895 RepID=F0S6S2_PSESL|nr:PhnA protein [Pseudopedobacter saltans DSM 12145]
MPRKGKDYLKCVEILSKIISLLNVRFEFYNRKMKLEQELIARSGGTCELCHSTENLTVYEAKPESITTVDTACLVCDKCLNQINKTEQLEPGHWTVLNETMWSEVPAVQVVAWRMLNRLRNETWAQDSLDILYLDDATLEWAKAAGDEHLDTDVEIHKDSNGNQLFDGDSVVLVKTLDVKGSSLSAKLGTVVKGIRLDPNNPEYIEGRVEGQMIVILTKYVRKQS